MLIKQFVLTLELNDDVKLISLYEQYHKPGNVWPEIIQSIRDSGIREMQIFRFGTTLVMLLQTDKDFSFENKAKLDSENPKVQEWESLMEQFQLVDSSQEEEGKWRPMQQIFSLSEH